MGTISDKLEYLVDTKEQLKQALTDKNVDIDENTTFRDFAIKTNENTDLVDTSDANAIATDIASGKSAYVGGNKINGALPNVSGSTITDINPIIDNSTLSLSGTITNEKGIIDANSSMNLSTTFNKIASAINLQATQIKDGETVLGVSGSVVELNGQTKTITPSTSEQVITPDQGYNAFTSVTIEAAPEDLTEQITAQEEIIAQLKEEVKNKAMGDAKLQSKDVSITQNGITTIIPDNNYDALSSVDVTVTGILDTSDANAIANDIAINKTAYVNGVKVTGTYDRNAKKQYKATIIDYTGEILDEIGLDAGESLILPEPPVHEGLVFDGWACTEEIINNTVTAIDQNILIGPYYYTESGATEATIDLIPSLGLTITINMNSGVNLTSIDWGDGNTTTRSGNNDITHTYDNYGTYIIKLYGCNKYYSYNNFYGMFSNNSCAHTIKELRLCKGFQFETPYRGLSSYNGYGFNMPNNLKYMSMPSDGVVKVTIGTTSNNTSTATIYGYMFQGYSLKCLILPKNIPNWAGSMCNCCQNISQYLIPYGITTLGCIFSMEGGGIINDIITPRTIVSYGIPTFKTETLKEWKYKGNDDTTITLYSSYFFNVRTLEKIVFPKNVVSLENGCISGCSSLRILDFSKTNNIPTLNISLLPSNNIYLKYIIVPDELYDEWITSGNWPTYTNLDCIIRASEYIEE